MKLWLLVVRFQHLVRNSKKVKTAQGGSVCSFA